MSKIIAGIVGCVCLLALAGCPEGNDGVSGEPGEQGDTGDSGAPGVKGKDGTPGAQGATGKTGVGGDPGTDGKAGAVSLITFADEPAGSHCASGGKRVNSGADSNGDGKLQASEIKQVAYLCDDASVAQAPSVLRAVNEPVGAHCVFGGTRLELGPDTDGDGALDDDEVNAAATHYICAQQSGWSQLADLPSVTTELSFALAAADDASPRLGFMFADDDYQAALLESGQIDDLGGVYGGANTYVTYALDDETNGWLGYEGRGTPQSYSYSELVIADDNSYYTTSYPAFGGLISVIKNGGKGAYALTPSSIYRRMHSIAVFPGASELYALVAQADTGLTLSTFPLDGFGMFGNLWTDLATLEPGSTEIFSPTLSTAGTKLTGAYVSNHTATIRATDDPSKLALPTDFKVIGTCADTDVIDTAWDGLYLYAACRGNSGFSVKRAKLDDLTNVVWEDIALSIVDDVDNFDLEANGTGASLAIRQGKRVRVYEHLTDVVPVFDAVISGELDLLRSARGLVLAVCSTDDNGVATLHTFLRQ